jgi:hypothetical protein
VGDIGECTPIDKYGEDPGAGNHASCLKSEGRACSDGLCRKLLGQACTSLTECISLKCGDPDMDGKKTCVKAPGEPCAANVECYSNACVNGTCM